VTSLKYKHQVKAEQLQTALSTMDIVFVFQSTHFTAKDFVELRKEARAAFNSVGLTDSSGKPSRLPLVSLVVGPVGPLKGGSPNGEGTPKVSLLGPPNGGFLTQQGPVYLTGRNSVYKQFVGDDQHKALVRLFSGPNFLFCFRWGQSGLASERLGLLALRRWFSACTERSNPLTSAVQEGSASAGTPSKHGPLVVMGGLFQGRLFSASDMEELLASKPSPWTSVWRLGAVEAPAVPTSETREQQTFLSGGQSLLPVLETLGTSDLCVGAAVLHCLEEVTAKG
jgi:hypothetical protein